jgi:hypothetical protein
MGADRYTMTAVEARLIRALYRRRRRFRILHFQQSNRTLGDTDTVALAFFRINSE